MALVNQSTNRKENLITIHIIRFSTFSLSASRDFFGFGEPEDSEKTHRAMRPFS